MSDDVTDPVEALARELAEHQERYYADAELITCTCDKADDLSPDEFARHLAAAVLASGVVVAADKVQALVDEPDEDLRMDAYYYGFEPTGVTAIDRILSAIAHAGKAYHHTESWNDDWAGRGNYLPHGGDTAVDAIQNAANAAAARLRSMLSEPAIDAPSEPASELEVPGDAPTPVAPATDAAPTGEAQAASLTQRLATALALALHDAHPVYGSTAGWRGGIGGQAMTPGCSFIDPAPGQEWTQYDLLSGPLREYLSDHPFDLDAAKEQMKAELNAAVSLPEGEQR